MILTRTFHPIGQGSYYSERFVGSDCELNIVYDCGNWRNTKLADKVVKQSFSKDDDIDILFISHLDFDHISKVPTLIKTVRRIKRVVMPLLHEDQKFFLANLFEVVYPEFKSVFTNPSAFFGEETEIIEVLPAEDGNFPEAQNEIEGVNIENISGSIRSFTALISSTIADWTFIPYNFKNNQRQQQLEGLLSKAGFDVELLKSSSDYFQRNITDAKQLRKLKKVYESVQGDVNQNSMFLYSGPINLSSNWVSEGFFKDVFLYKYSFRILGENPACIYTGDGDLNLTPIHRIYGTHWHHVGTIQIPHHGDLKCFEKSVLNQNHFICPISFGKNNSYGHPSTKVLGLIASQGSYPVQVTEDLNSSFIEIIKS